MSFAPHLLAFQHANCCAAMRMPKLAGACKDEWGFPPCFDGTPAHNDFWYSEPMATAYRNANGTRPRQRLSADVRRGNRAPKRIGKAPVKSFHGDEPAAQRRSRGRFLSGGKRRPSDRRGWCRRIRRGIRFATGASSRRTGLDWWAAHRDYAQTDEVTPFCVRTALAKKWNQSVWYNMFYAPENANTKTAIWSHALAGDASTSIRSIP